MLTVFADLSPVAAVFLGVGVAGLVSIPALLLADAHRSDFDPRPLLARAVRCEAVYPLLREFDNARHGARSAAVRVQRAPLGVAITAAAVAALLIPTSPEVSR